MSDRVLSVESERRQMFDLLNEAATLINDGRVAETETLKCVYREAIQWAIDQLRNRDPKEWP